MNELFHTIEKKRAELAAQIGDSDANGESDADGGSAGTDCEQSGGGDE